jgi:hypothetical protein
MALAVPKVPPNFRALAHEVSLVGTAQSRAHNSFHLNLLQNNSSKTSAKSLVKPLHAPQFPQLQQSKTDPRQKKFAYLPLPLCYP